MYRLKLLILHHQLNVPQARQDHILNVEHIPKYVHHAPHTITGLVGRARGKENSVCGVGCQARQRVTHAAVGCEGYLEAYWHYRDGGGEGGGIARVSQGDLQVT